MNRFFHLFPYCKSRPAIIGMVHVMSLPATPRHRHSVQEIVDIACRQTELYLKYKIHGVCIENMHDVPYVREKDAGPEIVSVMTRVGTEVKRLANQTPCGVQILAGLNRQALAVALAADLQFVRAEAFVFSHVADEGIMDACAGPLLRYRKSIGADHIAVLTDIKKKHCSHAITSDVDIIETAKTAEFFLSDGVIITGIATGQPPSVNDVTCVRSKVEHMAVLIGSGVNCDNLKDYARLNVNGLIVGSHFKINNSWQNEIDENKLANFMHTLENI